MVVNSKQVNNKIRVKRIELGFIKVPKEET